MSDPQPGPPIQPPLAVRPLDYSTPVPGRPGLITAIGVISIVVASLSLITNLGCGFQMSVFALMSRMAGPAGAAPPVSVTLTPRPFGLPAEQRELVTSALGEVRPLDEVQARHLEALLEEHGRHIFMVPETALTSDFIRNNVSASGTRIEGTDAPATHYIVGRGRIEISQSAATFRPDTGGTAFTASWQESEPEAGLTPEQVEAVLARIQGMAGANLDPAQVEAMRELLLAEDQDLIRLDWSGQPEDQINLATLQPDGTLFIQTNVGWISMDGGGAVISSSAAFMAGPPFQFSIGAMMTAGAGILANLALAVYLLVIGIMVLRQHGWGGWLHKVYAWLKIPAALLAGLGIGWIWMDLFSSLGAMGPGGTGGIEWVGVMYGVGVAVLGLIYPVALLIALRSRTVRDYYASVQVQPA